MLYAAPAIAIAGAVDIKEKAGCGSLKDTQKIKYNLIIGILGQIVTLILGIVIPKLVLTSYGSEINGLISSITNIYAYIAIVEAGITAASCQALYKPIAEQNRNDINGVLSATNRYYHKTGTIYLLLIFLFSILYPLFIKTELPFYSVVLIILFNGVGGVVNFFVHGKYLILLKADGKNYIRAGVEIFTTVAKQIAKIVFIALGYDVVLVQFVTMLVSFVQMLYITFYIKKNYGWIDLKAKPNFKAVSQSKNVLVHQVNYLISANTDTVILTFFCDLKIVSVYSLYILLYNMVDKVLHIVRDALEFKIANYFYTSKEKFLSFFRAYEVYYIAFSFSLYSVVEYFIHPFLKIYTAEVTDINYIVKYLPLFFALTKIWTVLGYPCDAMIHISGHFKQTQKAAIIESVINVTVSLALVSHYGIIGVLIGTVISAIFRALYRIIYVHTNVIENKSVWGSVKTIIINILVFTVVDVIGNHISMKFSSYFDIVLYCIPFTVCVFTVYFAANSLFEPKVFLAFRDLVKNVLKKGSDSN